MARYALLRWPGDPGGRSRSRRLGGRFEAYLPDPLCGREFDLTAGVLAALEDAAGDLGRTEGISANRPNTEVLARLLLRAEAVGSSQIEGLVIGPRRLLKAEALRSTGAPDRDVTANEVLGNIDAMLWAVETTRPGEPIRLDQLLETHRRLMAHTPAHPIGGQIRTEQNWIGGQSPVDAAYVPPPPDLVPDLLEDLVAFINTSTLPVLAKAAIAHAQFETIHPFADGNGRTGRALIHMTLRAEGLTEFSIPPISLSLATHADTYIASLTEFRHTGTATSSAARTAANSWIAMFAGACSHAVTEVGRLDDTIAALQIVWRKRIGTARADATVNLIIDALPAAPVLTVNAAAHLTGRSAQTTNKALAALTEVGILKQITVGRRNRAFEAPEVIDALALLERRFASPAADTRIEAPNRPVPSKPQ